MAIRVPLSPAAGGVVSAGLAVAVTLGSGVETGLETVVLPPPEPPPVVATVFLELASGSCMATGSAVGTGALAATLAVAVTAGSAVATADTVGSGGTTRADTGT